MCMQETLTLRTNLSPHLEVSHDPDLIQTKNLKCQKGQLLSKDLTFYNTVQSFNNPGTEDFFEHHFGKKEKMLQTSIFPLSTLFSTFPTQIS